VVNGNAFISQHSGFCCLHSLYLTFARLEWRDSFDKVRKFVGVPKDCIARLFELTTTFCLRFVWSGVGSDSHTAQNSVRRSVWLLNHHEVLLRIFLARL